MERVQIVWWLTAQVRKIRFMLYLCEGRELERVRDNRSAKPTNEKKEPTTLFHK